MHQPPRIWHWRGQAIAYRQAGEQGPAVLLIHGFGASSRHWRHNLPVLARQARVWAIDLIGFGASAKPHPDQLDYSFETWGTLVRDFCREVIGEPTHLIGNSIGCVVAMQAAVDEPEQVRSLVLINCSLRMLHERKLAEDSWLKQQLVPAFQRLLLWKPFGYFFFRQVAQPRAIRNALGQAYRNPAAIDDDLIELLLTPAQDPGAADVFLRFVTYSQGPLPEDLLPHLTQPTLILWGQEDPWEPIALARDFAHYPAVVEFVELPGAGHCPMDEAPELVNPQLQRWLEAQTAVRS